MGSCAGTPNLSRSGFGSPPGRVHQEQQMSNVAKFLIVLNLILAGVFVGSTANFLGQKDYMQATLEKEKSDLQARLTATRTEADALLAKNRELGNENTTLKEQIGVATQARTDTERQNQDLARQNAALSSNLAHATTRSEERRVGKEGRSGWAAGQSN